MLQNPSCGRPICDHNGNIHKVIDASDGSVVANYEYSPFGVLIGEWGPKKDVCPFRFQTKHYDHETEFYYFGWPVTKARPVKASRGSRRPLAGSCAR